MLEYNKETGGFHFNSGRSKPDTHGWTTIAETTDFKASLFCDALDCIINYRREKKLPMPSVEYIKTHWLIFCYWTNRIFCDVERWSEEIKEAKLKFNDPKALGVLRNPHFVEYWRDDKDSMIDYDPFDYQEANLLLKNR